MTFGADGKRSRQIGTDAPDPPPGPAGPDAGGDADDPALAFRTLGPDRLLDAVDATGRRTDGRVFALNSYENRVYSVGLEDGTFVVAKFYRPGRWSDAAILEEHEFCRELVERDLPVVAPLADADGRTLFRAGPFRLALFPRVGGRPPELDDPAQLGVVGRTLGRLHLVGDMHGFAERPRIGLERLGEAPREFLLGSPHLPPEVRRLATRLRATEPAVLRAVMASCDRVTGPPLTCDDPGHPLAVVRLLAAEALPLPKA